MFQNKIELYIFLHCVNTVAKILPKMSHDHQFIDFVVVFENKITVHIKTQVIAVSNISISVNLAP